MLGRYHSVSALLLLSLFTLTACISLSHCSEDKPTEPPKPIDTTSHEFVWEVDTLYWDGTTQPAFFTAKAMYAISATNVFMVGYTTGSKEMCWHWNGEEWKVLNLNPYIAGDVVDVDGLDSTFIVFAGWGQGTKRNSGMMALEDGVLKMLPLPLGERNRTCLHVVSRTEIYLGSVQGVQHYNGTEWEWLLDSTETTGNEFYPKYIQKFKDGTLEMVSQRNDNINGTKLFRWEWKDEQLVAIDSFAYTEPNHDNIRFGYRLHDNGTDVFATGNGGTFIRNGRNWSKIHDEGGYYVAGNVNNLIIGQGWTNFWHYNGSTTINLWEKMLRIVPAFRRINAINYIDDVLFVCGELDPITRDVIVLRGRHLR